MALTILKTKEKTNQQGDHKQRDRDRLRLGAIEAGP